MKKYAYVTVITNDSYESGVLALWHSVKKAGCKYPFVVMLSRRISDNVKKRLQKLMKTVVFSEDIPLDTSILGDNVGYFDKWNTTFFKLKVLQLCEYDKIVMLDADMIVMKNLDHLFQCPHMSCAYAEKLRGGPIRLNSGMIVLEPSEELYKTMIDSIIPTKNALKGEAVGDQDVFKYVYSDWAEQKELHLDSTYNCYNTDIDTFIQNNEFAFEDINIIHYTLTKPWDIKDSILFKQLLLNIFGRYKQKYFLKSNLLWKRHYRGALKCITK